METDYSKISVTAKLVAYFRKYSDIPFAADVASFVRADETMATLARQVSEETNGNSTSELKDDGKILAPMLEARYKSIAQLITRSGYKQVLEVASGLSLRGVAMTRSSDLAYVESDLQGINDEKKELIADLRSKYGMAYSAKHHIATANALNFDELEHAASPLDKRQPLIVTNEGLIPYLTEAELDTLAENVLRVLRKFGGGIWITPDFTTRQMAESVPKRLKRFQSLIVGATDRQLHSAAFESDEKMDRFFHEHRFEAVRLNQMDIVRHLSSCEALGIDRRILRCLKSRMLVWQLAVV